MTGFDTASQLSVTYAMSSTQDTAGDSPLQEGGSLPGKAGSPAFRFNMPKPSPIPVLIAAPHGGRNYPSTVLSDMRDPDSSRLKLEDRLIDVIAACVAAETGAALLVADAPRAMIDLNRAEGDVDWTMVEGASDVVRHERGSRRARTGLGLIPRRLPGTGEVWRSPLQSSELESRIEQIHRTYHDRLSVMLGDLHARWGAVLLIDLHSMPPLSADRYGSQVPNFVIGDRFGASSARSLSAAAFTYLEAQQERAAHNRPYAGGYVLDRHAAPSKNIHALQLEVCRSSYLGESRAELNDNAAAIIELLAGLVRKLANETASLAPPSGFRQAAE